LESPSECGIEPLGSISHRIGKLVIQLVSRPILYRAEYLRIHNNLFLEPEQ
jgi:hypothetical protein